ncbi:MAG: CvpA family protein [bacterium]
MSLVITFADFTIVAMCILFGYLGYRMGFYDSLLALIGFHFALGLSLPLMRYTVSFFSFVLELPPDMSLLLGLSFLFGLFTLLWVFFSQWIHSLVKMQVVEWFNRGAGILLGSYRGFLIVSLMALGFSILPLTQAVTYTETYSTLFRRIRCFLPMKYNYVRRLVPRTPSFEQTLIGTLRGTGAPEDRIIILWQRLGSCTLTPEQLEDMYR